MLSLYGLIGIGVVVRSRTPFANFPRSFNRFNYPQSAMTTVD